MPGHYRGHYSGDYQRRAANVRRIAYANPNTRCQSPQCKHSNGTLAEHRPGARWQAGHVIDTDPTSPLRPEVDECNQSAGARLKHQRLRGLVTTTDW